MTKTYTAFTTLRGKDPAEALGEALEDLDPAPMGVGVFEIEDDSGIWEIGGYFLAPPDEIGLALLSAAYNANPFVISEVPDTDWVDKVRRELTPVEAGRFFVYGSHDADKVPAGWRSFFQHGVLPSGEGMKFVFRAVTPPGRPRRFDARFFLVDTERVASDLDNFDQACDELSHLQWIPLAEARSFDLPFITEVALAEVEADLKNPARNARVPYFFNADGRSNFSRL